MFSPNYSELLSIHNNESFFDDAEPEMFSDFLTTLEPIPEVPLIVEPAPTESNDICEKQNASFLNGISSTDVSLPELTVFSKKDSRLDVSYKSVLRKCRNMIQLRVQAKEYVKRKRTEGL